MGIHFISRSWRAPLQLIDSWLPTPAPLGARTSIAAPLLQKFVRAGWLGTRSGTPSRQADTTTPPVPDRTRHVRGSSSVRLIRPTHTAREGGRLVISGRLADVCAELDRLAAMERPSGAH